MKPFIKWAGGKTQLLPVLTKKIQISKNTIYIEPFVGAGALFFHLLKNHSLKEYIISDINWKLINCYKTIKENHQELIENLTSLQNDYNKIETLKEKEKLYYSWREEFNKTNEKTIKMAAIFIAINKSCFNGLYRENSKGEYNVSFGKKEQINIFDTEQILEINYLLNCKNVKIINGNFDMVETMINKEEEFFIYADPPYRPVTKGGFASYDKSNFNDKNQRSLYSFLKKIDKHNVKWLLSNSDPKNNDENDDFFDHLYSEFTIERISAKRLINCDKTGRGAVTELLINNYERDEKPKQTSNNREVFFRRNNNGIPMVGH